MRDQTTAQVALLDAPEPDVFSLEGLIAWLERQPEETLYDYLDSSDCLGARYCHAHGLVYEQPPVGSVRLVCRNSENTSFQAKLEYVALRANPQTYGGALKLARTLP